MRRSFLTLLFSLSLCLSEFIVAEEVTLKHNNLELNANLVLTDESEYEKIFLITHGTLAAQRHGDHLQLAGTSL